jgi:prepilin-type processing-associated H-X9-DG protein
MNVWGLAHIALADGHVRQATILLAATRPLFETYVIGNTPVDNETMTITRKTSPLHEASSARIPLPLPGP